MRNAVNEAHTPTSANPKNAAEPRRPTLACPQPGTVSERSKTRARSAVKISGTADASGVGLASPRGWVRRARVKADAAGAALSLGYGTTATAGRSPCESGLVLSLGYGRVERAGGVSW